MAQSERERWWKSITDLKTAYRVNLIQIKKLEKINKLILQEAFTKVDKFEGNVPVSVNVR